MKTLQKLFSNASSHAANVSARAKAIMVAGSTAVASAPAFAGGGGFSFDGATIIAAIGVMVAAGVLIYTAYVLGRWTLKVFGLLGK